MCSTKDDCAYDFVKKNEIVDNTIIDLIFAHLIKIQSDSDVAALAMYANSCALCSNKICDLPAIPPQNEKLEES